MKISEDDIVKAYCHYHNLINETPCKYEFEFEGYTLQFSPDVCMDTSLKWHLRAKRGDGEFRLVGAVLNLFDAIAIISKKYLDDIYNL